MIKILYNKATGADGVKIAVLRKSQCRLKNKVAGRLAQPVRLDFSWPCSRNADLLQYLSRQPFLLLLAAFFNAFQIRTILT
jgi:hypothetical protein